ncbi:hypothetical protein FISHEDRAFT_51219 [Fistulina hepatica ATCC 64428]|uniref:Uncharacterized protein n=1 Tax=Fistulina hepatica ATCC 64428 TaxID=1128425 RepID=A0A0D7A0J1_9AGAR|nr:hypothetical protein FISHEDRAFT_51219 [Fistulina hepatica ATCC 64428]
MSANKYANLPDIDTAPDIYETEEVFPVAQIHKADEDDEETAPPGRNLRGKAGADQAHREELDTSELHPEHAKRTFKKAEKRRTCHSHVSYYAYPSSPTSEPSEGLSVSRSAPLPVRLRALKAELAALESELADPTNPALFSNEEEKSLAKPVDPGELIRGLVDVRARLDKIRKDKEGRGRLVGAILADDMAVNGTGPDHASPPEKLAESGEDAKSVGIDDSTKMRAFAEVDRRVGELERLVGSSSVILDETSPLPPALLPLLTRINTQLTLLTQPRHIDAISRRLKLLISDLERANAAQHHAAHRRHPSQQSPQTTSQSAAPLHEQLLPLLNRLGPSLPQIPHIVERLRTLSALHASAADFQSTLTQLEQEQAKSRAALRELEAAVSGIEEGLKENRKLIRGNVTGLEARVDGVVKRLDVLGRMS